MTRVLIFGVTGMLGHKLAQTLVAVPAPYTVYGTTRSPAYRYEGHFIFDKLNLIGNVSAEDPDSVARAFAVKPEVVINCVGLVKQKERAHQHIPTIEVNALFPHRLATLCAAAGARLIHISTDCVFSGERGGYRADDKPDAVDLYGLTKLLGEVDYDNALTLRTSFIGRELGTSFGLLEWFLQQNKGKVKGYRRAIFSGLTTFAFSEIIERLIRAHPEMSGLWHVAGPAISKYELLLLIRQVYGLELEIEADEEVVVDRSLDARPFWREVGMERPTWPEMIREMYQDPTPY